MIRPNGCLQGTRCRSKRQRQQPRRAPGKRQHQTTPWTHLPHTGPVKQGRCKPALDTRAVMGVIGTPPGIPSRSARLLTCSNQNPPAGGVRNRAHRPRGVQEGDGAEWPATYADSSCADVGAGDSSPGSGRVLLWGLTLSGGLKVGTSRRGSETTGNPDSPVIVATMLRI